MSGRVLYTEGVMKLEESIVAFIDFDRSMKLEYCCKLGCMREPS